MDYLLIIVSVMTMICIIILLYVAFSKIKPIKVNSRETENDSMPKFQTDYYADPYPKTVDLSNQYECTVEDPHICKVGDATTLFGCKNLAVKCHVFEEDTMYQTSTGEMITIPKSKEGEGLALALEDVSEGCNIHHGDWVIVATDPDSREFGLMCLCKNPGYIGNETLSGACDKVFICNGQIDDINKPLADINCVCGKFQYSLKREDGAPVCTDILVKDADASMSDAITYIGETIDTSKVNPTVTQNMKIDKVLNPCTTSLFGNKIDGTITMSYINSTPTYWCQFPIRSNILHHKIDILRNSYASDLPSIGYQTDLSDYSSGQQGVQMATAHAGHPDSFAFVGKYPELNPRPLVVAAPGVHLGLSLIVNGNDNNWIVHGRCTGSWPTYSCRLKYEDGALLNSYGRLYSNSRSCPSAFLWGKDHWNNSEAVFGRYHTWVQVSEGDTAIDPPRYQLSGDGLDPFRDNSFVGVLFNNKGLVPIDIRHLEDFEYIKNSEI